MAFSLPDLLYARYALAPHISEQTLNFHYDKHHCGYIDKLNRLTEGKPEAAASLEELISETWRDAERKTMFNNAAQAWNHAFYWHSMKPDGGGAPEGAIAEAVAEAFGDLDGFKEAFKTAGKTQFGSGWAWLVLKDGKLEVRKTPNAELPLTENGATPLLTMDVWEHAYYLDYQNKRGDYISAFLDHLINWDFANVNFELAS